MLDVLRQMMSQLGKAGIKKGEDYGMDLFQEVHVGSVLWIRFPAHDSCMCRMVDVYRE